MALFGEKIIYTLLAITLAGVMLLALRTLSYDIRMTIFQKKCLTHFFQVCGKTLGNKQKLQRHIMEVHQRLRNHICRVCNKGFPRAEKLKQHEETAHDESEIRERKPLPVRGKSTG